MKQGFSCYDAKLETSHENCICFGFSGGFFGFVVFLKAVPEYRLTQKGRAGFVPEDSVCTGAGQTPSHVKTEGHRLRAAVHFAVAGAKAGRGENNITHTLVTSYLPLSTS